MSSDFAYSRWLSGGLIAAGSAGAVLALAGTNSAARGPGVLLFLAAAPAMTVAGFLAGLDIFSRIFVACTAAIALNALVAEVMLACGNWSPRAGLIVIGLICAVSSVLRLPPVRAALGTLRSPVPAATDTSGCEIPRSITGDYSDD